LHPAGFDAAVSSLGAECVRIQETANASKGIFLVVVILALLYLTNFHASIGK
jgi:hypothetical protein